MRHIRYSSTDSFFYTTKAVIDIVIPNVTIKWLGFGYFRAELGLFWGLRKIRKRLAIRTQKNNSSLAGRGKVIATFPLIILA
jgi:hypothetical protein